MKVTITREDFVYSQFISMNSLCTYGEQSIVGSEINRVLLNQWFYYSLIIDCVFVFCVFIKNYQIKAYLNIIQGT